jgi:hypothetical protein
MVEILILLQDEEGEINATRTAMGIIKSILMGFQESF